MVKKVFFVFAGGFVFLLAAWVATRPISPRFGNASTEIRPGVIHRTVVDKHGPWRIHVVEVNLLYPELRVEAACAQDRLYGREATSSIAARRRSGGRRVIAAINGDYFNPSTGEVQNNHIAAGNVIKSFTSMGFRRDLVDVPNTQFAMTADRRPLLDQFTFEGNIFWKDGSVTGLSGVNITPRRGGFVVLNGHSGTAPASDIVAGRTTELSLEVLSRRGDTLVCIEPARDVGAVVAAGEKIVLREYFQSESVLAREYTAGDTVRLFLGMNPYYGSIPDLIGGWPRIIRNGKNIFHESDFPENPKASVFSKRHPRSGVGFSRDSTTLFLVTVDGRQEFSVGMSLPEFADYLISIGVHNGLNLDGGGSTTLVIGGDVVNSPSDPTGERPVGNCLLVVVDSTRLHPDAGARTARY